MKPGAAGEDDYPWKEMYRRALASGIGDDAFWRMSPAALISVTSGRKKAAGRRAQAGLRAEGGSKARKHVMRLGSAADCP